MPFDVTVDSIGVGRADISWTFPSGASQAYIYTCTGALCAPTAFIKYVADVGSAQISGLPGETYRYNIVVYDDEGFEIDVSNVFEITYTAGDVPSNWRYYYGSAFAQHQLNGFDDTALSPPANGLILSINGINPLSNPFVRVVAGPTTSQTTSTPSSCVVDFYHWDWHIFTRTNEGGVISEVTTPGDELGVTCLPGESNCETNANLFTSYDVYVEFRSAYYDLTTQQYIPNSGYLQVSIDADLLVDIQDWNHRFAAGVMSFGAGVYRYLPLVWVNGINTHPVNPLDPNLLMYQDFADVFTPSGSLTTGLTWFDPTFGSTSPGFQDQAEGRLESCHDGAYNAYDGVGIGVVLVPRVTTNGGGEGSGTIIVNKIVSPNDGGATAFTGVVGGGLSPNIFSLHHGEEYIYTEVAIGSGYSFVETPVTGYTTSYSVSNGSPHTNVTVADGETVIVTIVNVQDEPPGSVDSTFSGVYKIVPGKRNDTLWENLDDATTRDVKIPNPKARLGFIGE